MESLKLGSKSDGFQRRGQAWFCTTGLPSDMVIEVEEMTFHLHKFPLISRSGRIANLVAELPESDEQECYISLPDLPGGAKAFELAAKFCYGVNVELSSGNVVALRCAAEYLEMTEEFGEGNLAAKAESFFCHIVLHSWKDSIRALQSCASSLALAENLKIVKKCVDSIARRACTDPSLFGWPMMDQNGSMQSPGGTILWNGINTGAKPRNSHSGWWYDDIAILSLPLFKKVITSMAGMGVRPEIIAGALVHYAKKFLPSLSRREDGHESGNFSGKGSFSSSCSEEEQVILLETIESLLPLQKGLTSTKFLFGLLRLATILNATSECRRSLEKRIGAQLEQGTVDDLLIPSFSYTVETLYDIDAVQRILDDFLMLDQKPGPSSFSLQSFEEGSLTGSPSGKPMMLVAKLMDGYLAEVAPDENLKPAKFQALAEALPEYARARDDGLYRAIDIYLKAHPWLLEHEQEMLCRIIDCQKLSLEACSHAAQNERLPLRVVVQVLFFEQLQLRSAIAGCFHVTDVVDNIKTTSSNLIGESAQMPYSSVRGNAWEHAIHENQMLKMNIDKMKNRVNDLEKECIQMRQEIESLEKGKASFISFSLNIFGCKGIPQICHSHESVSAHKIYVGATAVHGYAEKQPKVSSNSAGGMTLNGSNENQSKFSSSSSFA